MVSEATIASPHLMRWTPSGDAIRLNHGQELDALVAEYFRFLGCKQFEMCTLRRLCETCILNPHRPLFTKQVAASMIFALAWPEWVGVF